MIASFRYCLQERRLPEMHDGVGRNRLLVDAPAADLSPVDVQGRRHDLRQAQRGGRGAVEQRVHDLSRLPPHGLETRHVAADDAGADEGVERPVHRRGGGCGHGLDGFTRREMAAVAVLEVAGREHHGVASQLTQTFQHGIGRQTREKLDRRAVLETRDLASQPGFPCAVPFATSPSPAPDAGPADASAAPGRWCRRNRTRPGRRPRRRAAPGSTAGTTGERPCGPPGLAEKAPRDCRRRKRSASSLTATITSGGRDAYFSRRYVATVRA